MYRYASPHISSPRASEGFRKLSSSCSSNEEGGIPLNWEKSSSFSGMEGGFRVSSACSYADVRQTHQQATVPGNGFIKDDIESGSAAWEFVKDRPVDRSGYPRVLLVGRRMIRKNKYVNFVSEVHLDLIQRFDGIPVIVPRSEATLKRLELYMPMDGFIIAEGEDLGLAYDPYGHEKAEIDEELMQQTTSSHPSDAFPDMQKDQIEWELLAQCLERGIPFLGLCRGAQVLNVISGGSLWYDISHQVKGACKHIDYTNYDGYRHPLLAVRDSPMKTWFREECTNPRDDQKEKPPIDSDNAVFIINVNSYHHQGIRKLAPRFSPIAYSPDGLVEAFYDEKFFSPEKGRFCVGLQFHPERMWNDYAGCVRVYEDFMKACWVRYIYGSSCNKGG